MITLKQSVAAVIKGKFENRLSESIIDTGVFCKDINQSIVLDRSDLANHKVAFSPKYNTYAIIAPTVYIEARCFVNFSLNTSDYKTAVKRRDILLKANSFAIKDTHEGEDFNGFYSISCKVVAIEYSNSKIEYTSLFEQELKGYNFDFSWDNASVTDEVFPSMKLRGVLPGMKNILLEFHSDLASGDSKLVPLACKVVITSFVLFTILLGIKDSLKLTAFISGFGFGGGVVKGAVDRNREIKSFSN